MLEPNFFLLCNSCKHAFFHPLIVLSLSVLPKSPENFLITLAMPCSAAYFTTIAFCSIVAFKYSSRRIEVVPTTSLLAAAVSCLPIFWPTGPQGSGSHALLSCASFDLLSFLQKNSKSTMTSTFSRMKVLLGKVSRFTRNLRKP